MIVKQQVSIEVLRSIEGDILFGGKCILVDMWPKPQAPLIAEHVPPAVERALAQAESNFSISGNEDAAAIMYRRAMEAGLKIAYPDVSGSLYARIERLAEKGELPQALREWAHEVRIVGNDGAHEEEGASKEDIKAARAFTDTLMRYLFTLPEQVRRRQASRVPVA